MKNPRFAVFCTLIIACGTVRAQDEVPAPEVGISVRETTDARIIDAVLPGRSLDSAVSSAGEIAILLALQTALDGPRSIYRFDAVADGSLIELARDLPSKLDAIALLELEGDGQAPLGTSHRQRQASGTLLVVGEPGRIYSLGALGDDAADRQPRRLLEAHDLDLDQLSRDGLISSDRLFVPRPLHSRLDVYHWNESAVLQAMGTIKLPARARRVRTGLVLSTPPARILEREDQQPLLAIGPEPQGKRRLLTTLVEIGKDPVTNGAGHDLDQSEVGGEAWTRFSTNERIAQSWYLTVDGRPMLGVAALSADKLGIFEKKKLRIFPLRTDRTRAGSPPALEIETATRNWYDLGVQVRDLDNDGRDDLVVIQPDGLGAKKLVVEAYRGKGTGGFFLTPRRSVVVAPDADWIYGEDLDGDRVPDLVAATGDRLLVFRGLGTVKKKIVIEKTPHWTFETTDLGDLPASNVTIHVGSDADDHSSDSDSDAERTLAPPRVVDLDSDGRGEILLQGEVGGRTVLRVIELH